MSPMDRKVERIAVPLLFWIANPAIAWALTRNFLSALEGATEPPLEVARQCVEVERYLGLVLSGIGADACANALVEATATFKCGNCGGNACTCGCKDSVHVEAAPESGEDEVTSNMNDPPCPPTTRAGAYS